jgi:hypothetical protein
LTDDERPRLIQRARAGDWEALEDLATGASAPTFDAAFHLFADQERAAKAAEDALLALLLEVRRGQFVDGDPLGVTGRALADSARAAGISPFSTGLTVEDLVLIGRRPDDARGTEIGRLAPEDRVAAVLAFALDLAPQDLAHALGERRGSAVERVARVLDVIPAENPEEALHAILDERASRARVPADLEERVLDRYEKEMI